MRWFLRCFFILSLQRFGECGGLGSLRCAVSLTLQGNFFKLEAETKLSDKQSQNLRYGLEGRAVMITGKKTYFQYYVDQFLNKK